METDFTHQQVLGGREEWGDGEGNVYFVCTPHRVASHTGYTWTSVLYEALMCRRRTVDRDNITLKESCCDQCDAIQQRNIKAMFPQPGG